MCEDHGKHGHKTSTSPHTPTRKTASVTRRDDDDDDKKIAATTAAEPKNMTSLPFGFYPSSSDIIVGTGREAKNHKGNKNFKEVLKESKIL